MMSKPTSTTESTSSPTVPTLVGSDTTDGESFSINRLFGNINGIFRTPTDIPFTKPVNMEDSNIYILKLNNQSNAIYLAIMVLVLGILYIIVIYLFSFLFIPINTITTESNMFSSLIFNPDSTINVFHKYIKSNVRDGFSNISNNSTIQNISEMVSIYTKQGKAFVQYWFHRMLLFFHIKNGSITNTKKINRVSFMDLTY